MTVLVVIVDIDYRTIMLWLFFILFVNNVNAQGILVEFQMFYGHAASYIAISLNYFKGFLSLNLVSLFNLCNISLQSIFNYLFS